MALWFGPYPRAPFHGESILRAEAISPSHSHAYGRDGNRIRIGSYYEFRGWQLCSGSDADFNVSDASRFIRPNRKLRNSPAGVTSIAEHAILVCTA